MELEDESNCIIPGMPQSPRHSEGEERHCTGGAGGLSPQEPSEQQEHSPLSAAQLTAAQSLNPRVLKKRGLPAVT